MSEISHAFPMRAEVRKAFYAAYEARKNETITHPIFKYKLTFISVRRARNRLIG